MSNFIPLHICKQKHSQIFFNIPSIEWVKKFLEDVYGIKDFDYTKTIKCYQLDNILKQMLEYIPEMSLYVRNYFINFWFNKHAFSFRKAITILKHFVQLHNYNVASHILYTWKNNKLSKSVEYKVYKMDNLKPFKGINILFNTKINDNNKNKLINNDNKFLISFD